MNRKLVLILLLLFVIIIISCSLYEQRINLISDRSVTESMDYVWAPVSVKGGGYTTFVITDPKFPGRLYAGIDVGGVYRSDDYGEHWTPYNKGIIWPADRLAAAFTIHPENGSLFLGVGGFKQGGILMRNSDGDSWKVVTRDVKFYVGGRGQNRGASLIVVDPVDPKIIYAASYKNGLFVSKDGGRTWNLKGLEGKRLSSLLIHPQTPKIIYAAYVNGETRGGISRSLDGGNSWIEIGSIIDDVYQLHIDPEDTDIIYAAVGTRGIFKTLDGGMTWSEKNHGLDFFLKTKNFDDLTRYISLTVDTKNTDIIYVGNTRGGVYKSINGGDTWINLTENRKNIYPDGWWIQERQLLGNKGFSVNSIVIDPENANRIYISGGSGVWRSDDSGNTWHAKVEGLEATCMNRIVLSPHKRDVFYVGNTDWLYFYSMDGGRTIERSLAGMGNWDIYDYREVYKKYRMKNGNDFAFDPRTEPNTVYIAGDATPSVVRNSGTVFKSMDGGKSWREANKGLPVARVSALAINPSNYDILYAALYMKGMYKTTDGGNNWRPINNGLPDIEGLFEKYINEILISPSSPETVYVLDKGNGIYKTVDGGRHWSIVSYNLPEQGFKGMQFYSGGLTIDPKNPETLYVGLYKNGVYKTSDGGRNWRKISPSYIVNAGSMDIDPQTGAIYVVSVPEAGEVDLRNVEFGLYMSINEGKTWLAIHSDDLMNISLRIKDLTVDPHYKGRVYLVTQGNGIVVGEPAMK